MLKPPLFWKKFGLINFLLLPFSGIYFLFYFFYKKFNKEVKINVPVICVGNIVLGGAGKTPFSIKLRQLLSKDFSKIYILTRGYKGKKKGPLIVNQNMNYNDVGDESLIHSYYGLTCMSKSKVEGARLCVRNHADLIILDDGFQSKNIIKDFSILILDPDFGIKNKYLFPAGPLRQPFKEAIKKCDAILILDDDFRKKNYDFIEHKNIFFGLKKMSVKKLKNKNVLAFSGLGNNYNFFKGLKKLNIQAEEVISFPDHHRYTSEEIQNIIKRAEKKNLSIVCTKKDYIKIPKKFRKKIFSIDLDISINQPKKLHNLIIKKLKKAST